MSDTLRADTQNQDHFDCPETANDFDVRAVTCVDLDGTLIATDTLWESLLALLRSRPTDCFLLPFWLFQGKAAFKREVCSRSRPKPEFLPYRAPILDFLKKARAAGSKICLVTAADKSVASEIASHLGLFDEVIASDNNENLKGVSKAKRIQHSLDGQLFDYIGDNKADIPVWKMAGRAIVVNPNRALLNQIERNCPVCDVVYDSPMAFKDVLRALRVHQWVKNLLLFVPLVLSHEIGDLDRVAKVAIGFIALSLFASAFYLLNDLLDLESDRRHPRKRERPLAAGKVSIEVGLFLAGAFLVTAILISLSFLSAAFTVLLLSYGALTGVYSLYLKGKLMVDVLTLAGLYVYRIVAGNVIVDVAWSAWLLAFSLFFFLSLAFVKRYSELEAIKLQQSGRAPGRGYYVEDLDMIRVIGPCAGYISVLVLALYVSSDAVTRLYVEPMWLWFICVCVLYWITRIWFLAHRKQMSDDPVLFAVRDRISYLCGVAILAFSLLASFGYSMVLPS